MRKDDAQVGAPNTLYMGTKLDIESTFATKGQFAFNTDTDEYGCYNGSEWVWGAGVAYLGTLPIVISGSTISHDISGVVDGVYLAANVTVDTLGHITAISNGTSASSVGAPSDSPFVTSGSSASLTNYKVMTAGSSITIDSSGSTIIIHSTGGIASISGSGVMSTTTGSSVKHNVSGITSGSYNQVLVDVYGHVTTGSIVPLPVTLSSGSGYFLNGYNAITGSFTSGSVSSSAGGHIIQSSGSVMAVQPALNFKGAGTEVTNNTSASSTDMRVDFNVHSNELIAGDSFTIPAGTTSVIGSPLTVSGALVIDGAMVMV